MPAGVMLVVGGYRAGGRQLWEDEYATWHASTLASDDFLRLIGHVDLGLSPYYLFMQGWITAFGDSPLALRAPSVVAMALAAGLVAVLGRRLFGTAAGLLAGLLFAAVPSVSRYAQEARPYGIVMFLAVLATLLLLRAIDRPTWPRWLGYGVVLVLLGLAHLVALAIAVGHVLAVSYTARARDQLRLWRWLGAAVLAATLVGPFALAAAAESSAVSWIRADRATLRALPGQLFGSGPVAAAVVGLAVIGAYLLVRTAGAQLPLLTGWALAPPVLTFVTFGLLHLLQFRYLLFTLPAWALLAAGGITEVLRRCAHRWHVARPVWRVVAGTLVLAATAGLGVPGQVEARRDPAVGYPDYRGAARLVTADVRPGDAIAYGGTFYRVRRGMTYEMRGLLRPRDIFLYESAERLGGYVARECPAPFACLGSTRRIWLVNTTLSTDPFAELSQPIAALIKERCTEQRRWDLVHLHVVLLEVRPET